MSSEDKLKSIISAFLAQHSRVIDNDPCRSETELYNICQHIFSFEEEMNQ